MEEYIKEIFERIAGLESRVQILTTSNFAVIGFMMVSFGTILVKKIINGGKK